jgi:hypothetical protein
MDNHHTKKSQEIHLALNTLLGLNELKYSLPKAYVFLFMNFTTNERPLAHNQPRHFRLCFRINSIML